MLKAQPRAERIHGQNALRSILFANKRRLPTPVGFVGGFSS